METLEMVWKIVMAALLGGVVGLEREARNRPAGLKTHMLVAIGATLFTIISFSVSTKAGVDPTRIAAGIVTGIGFLGAGAVMRMECSIHGLTTAASIWAVSAIGMAVGAGLFSEAFVTTLVVLIVLFLTKFEQAVVHKDHDKKEKV